MKKKLVKSNELELQVFSFLQRLRSTGKVNMFGATVHINEHFGDQISNSVSHKLLAIWMDEFNPAGDYSIVEYSSLYHAADRVIDNLLDLLDDKDRFCTPG